MENISTRHHLGHDSVSKLIFKIKVTGKVKTTMYIDKGFKKENNGKYIITWNLGKCFCIKVKRISITELWCQHVDKWAICE